MEYYDIYTLRLNQYGTDYQSRLQNKREKQFKLYLDQSVYRVEFTYDNSTIVGSLEKYKQDETQTLQYFLTDVDTNIAPGAILEIPDKDNVNKPWMVYYLESIKASGYNRYILLRMTHSLTWVARDGKTYTSWAYMYGQENNMLKDELKSRSRMDTLYNENLKSSFFVLPKNEHIKKDDYFIIGESPFQEYYRVTGYDLQSTDGVEYVTIDPVYQYDLTAAPTYSSADTKTDFFWLHNGTLPATQVISDNTGG